MKLTRLSQKEQWESRWSNVRKQRLAFDPKQPLFRETHKLLQNYLPCDSGRRFLEVGAYPGKYLWYFHRYYGYEPWGIEYVESCAEKAKELLRNENVPANIIAKDFFDFSHSDYGDEHGWDVVASFGFVEHFDQPEIAVSRHLEVARPDGYVVVSVPNHAGWNGNIMKVVDKNKWSQHNRMNLPDLVRAFEVTGGNQVLFAGHVGHLGFWNTCLYETAKSKLGALYPLVRAPLSIAEHLGSKIVPNNGLTSPELVVIAQKSTAQ